MLDTSVICKKGGKHKGAGRKPASYKTTTIAYRVRFDWVEELKETIKNKINELKARK